MRLRAAAAAALTSVSVLSVGWLVGAPAVESLKATLTSTLSDATSTAAPSTTTPTSRSTAAQSATTPTGATGATGAFEGSVVQTRYGPMQVSVTIDNGTITDVTPLQLTTDGQRSVLISNQAAPILRAEVLAAQSSSVANVSGATYTTQGYRQSLQAALDAAQF